MTRFLDQCGLRKQVYEKNKQLLKVVSGMLHKPTTNDKVKVHTSLHCECLT